MTLRRHFMMTRPPADYICSLAESAGDARIKWDRLVAAFQDAGATVTKLDGDDPRIIGGKHIYCRDQAVIIGRTAYLPDMEYFPYSAAAHDQTERVLTFTTEKLEKMGYETVTATGSWFEGGNILRHASSRTLFMGVKYDSGPVYAAKLERTIKDTQPEKWSVHPVQMRRPQPLDDGCIPSIYHLDLAMTDELPNGEMLVYPRAAFEETLDTIGRIIGKEKLIPVENTNEVFMAALNLNHAGNTIVLTSPAPETAALLKGQGYDVVTPDRYGLKTFSFGWAGVHCLTNELSPG